MRYVKRAFESIGRVALNRLAIFLAIASVYPLSGCSTSLYLAKLGWGQAKIAAHSRPNEHVLNDPSVEDSTKERIRLVLEAKAYGEEHMGLTKTSSYSRFYQVDGSPLLYVVSASPKDRLEPYEWWFPITGTVTAKGFFSRKDAIQEKEKLERKGFDVFVQGDQAYSTLGWLKDPIFSTMLDQDSAMIVNVVIHEMTHATVFFKDQLDFNEQIAFFVGGQGAVDFAGTKYGQASLTQKRAIGFVEDGILFARFMKDVCQRLNDLYDRPISMERKLREREAVFLQAKQDFIVLSGELKTDSYLGFEDLRLNNAVVLALGRYIVNIEQIQRVYESLGRDLERTVSFFKEMKKSRVKDPEEYVSQWLKERQGGSSTLRGNIPWQGG